MVGEVNAVAADDGIVLLDCFARWRGPFPRGNSQSDIEAAFPGWKVTDVEVVDTEPDTMARLLKFDEHPYRLRRE
jgi:hypothetical protein